MTHYLDTLARIKAEADAKTGPRRIGKALREVCRRLTRFEGPLDDEWDDFNFPAGVLYNGDTKALTDFILDAASEAGWARPRTVTRTPDFYRLEYKPWPPRAWWSTYSLEERMAISDPDNLPEDLINLDCPAEFLFVVGSGKQVSCLYLSKESGLFEYDANPLGDSALVPLLNVRFCADELAFDVLTDKPRSIRLVAQNPTDRLFFGLVAALHGRGVPAGIRTDHHMLELVVENGAIRSFHPTARDRAWSIIPLSRSKMPVLEARNYDVEGHVVHEGQPNALPVVSTRYTVMDLEDPSEHFKDVTTVSYSRGDLHVETADRSYDHHIRTIPLIDDFLTGLFASDALSQWRSKI